MTASDNNRKGVSKSVFGGVLLFFIAIGFIGVSVMKMPVERSNVDNTDPSNENTNPVIGQKFAQRIQTSQPGETSAPGNTSGKPAQTKPVKFNIKEQRNLVQATLHRRNDENSARERDDKLTMPEWEKIINPGGTLKDDVNANGMYGSNGIPDYIDLYRGVEAEFIQENISDGVATDMSALLPGSKLEDEVLYNGAVRREHDLGNAYVLATIGADNHLRLYAGVERLVTDEITFIEIEFNQSPVRIGSGSPWPVIGKREEGDLLVRMVFSNRALQSVQLEQWRENGFEFLKTGAGISADSCRQKREFMYCVGVPPIRHPEDGFEVWDEDNNVLDSTLADNFVEVGVDVDLLVGPQVDITSVLFRTPEDIAMNNFRVFKKLAQLDESFASRTGLIQRNVSAK